MARSNFAELSNPCLKEQQITYKCLDNNNYQKDLCSDHFDNYNNCKKFWAQVTAYRRAQGIEPYLPPINERAAFKEEYLKKFKNKSQSNEKKYLFAV